MRISDWSSDVCSSDLLDMAASSSPSDFCFHIETMLSTHGYKLRRVSKGMTRRRSGRQPAGSRRTHRVIALTAGKFNHQSSQLPKSERALLCSQITLTVPRGRNRKLSVETNGGKRRASKRVS